MFTFHLKTSTIGRRPYEANHRPAHPAGFRNKPYAAERPVQKNGISPSAINQYISGNFEPKQNNIYLLAKALNVNEAWLMGYDVSIERSDNSLPLITEQEVALLRLFRKLSETGREEALKRMEELSALSRYLPK